MDKSWEMLDYLMTLEYDWGGENQAPPNRTAYDNAAEIIRAAEEYTFPDFMPTRVFPLGEGGISIAFKQYGISFDFDCYNNSKIFWVCSRPDIYPEVRKISKAVISPYIKKTADIWAEQVDRWEQICWTKQNQ